jgi:hypothetical protein
MEKRLLDFNEVVKRYSFKPWGLRWLMRTRAIDGMVRVGNGRGRIYFDPIVLEQWIKRHTIPTAKMEVKEK